MSDFENSDDERYANESFENESDYEIPEMSEFESETTENSDNDDADDDVQTSVKINTGPIKRGAHRLNAIRNTDTIPFASSSDEEDDVVVGQTLAEINTPSMHFEEKLSISSIRSSRSILLEKNYRLKSVEEFIEENDEEEEEEEFQKIKEMEERYMQQNSAKTPKQTEENNVISNSLVDDDDEKYLTTDEENEEQEAETETENELETDDENVSADECDHNDNVENKQQNLNVHSTESQGTLLANTCQQANNLDSPHSERTLENDSNGNSPLDQANLMQMIQHSLENLSFNENDLSAAGGMLQANGMMSNDPDAIINTQNVALALVNAIKSSSLTNIQSLANADTKPQADNDETNIGDNMESDGESNAQLNSDQQRENIVAENGDCHEDDVANDETETGDDDIEEIPNNGQICELDYDDEEEEEDIYFNSQLDYRITSKTPSSFNSDDYLFHANFIKPFLRTKLNDNLRVKPQPRKSMSFSNERMREIERHNQILLRKIITQKPTYTAKNKSDHALIPKLLSQTNVRPTTSAVNRKKQQRQIDMDNQVLKRKIEAISLRRRPLIS